MTRRPPRSMSDGRADRSIDELVAIAIADLTEIREQARWREAELDGNRRSGEGGSSDTSDPTHSQVAGRFPAAKRLGKAKAQLAWLVDTKLPMIAGELEARADDPRYDEQPRMSDEDRRDADGKTIGPARPDGGVSAYRGDRKVPHSRPDLHEALEAQRRRLARGEGYGRA